MAVLIVILIISFLVIIHELGHFFTAKKVKINVEEFGLGYPPKIRKLFSWKGTNFTLNLIPFGGFVRLEGENGPDGVEKKIDQAKPNEWGPFYTKTAKQRLIVILSGVVVNLLFGVIAFSIVFSFIGIPTELTNQARIGWVLADSPAAESGLSENVNIIEIRTDQNIYKITDFTEVQEAVAANKGQNLTIITSLTCDGIECPQETEEFNVYVRTDDETPEGEGSLGIVFESMVYHFYPWYQMPFRGTWYGVKQAIGLGYLIVQALVQMVAQLVSTGQVPEDVAGPVGIVYEAQQGNIITDDFWSNLGFAGMLSINLGVMNLLPIPALDGGRALFILLEKIFGKKHIQKIEVYANYGGLALLMLLILMITYKDIMRIVIG